VDVVNVQEKNMNNYLNVEFELQQCQENNLFGQKACLAALGLQKFYLSARAVNNYPSYFLSSCNMHMKEECV
jgi:hypothetical protein